MSGALKQDKMQSGRKDRGKGQDPDDESLNQEKRKGKGGHSESLKGHRGDRA